MTVNKEIYFEQLNGIRFIAVFLVLLDHWLIPINPFSFLGHLGVVIFFVLSGFLITRILFQNSDDVRINKSSPAVKIIRFIYRRSLRIFPIYFLLLFIGALFSLSNFYEFWPFLLFYIPNFYIILHGTWLGIWDHLWSLAVEEQYYLLFPYFIGTRLSFFLGATHAMKENNWMWWYVNPLSAVDCFGLGGVLAYLYHYKQAYFQTIRYLKIGLILSLLGFVLVLYLSTITLYPHDNIWSIVYERLLGAILAFFLIALCLRKQPWILSAFLKDKMVSYLGQISYGIYLYHNLVMNYYHDEGNTIWYYLKSYLPNFHLELVNFTIYKFLISFLVLICISSLSWFVIETVFNAKGIGIGRGYSCL
jgi:peptidoglycan/LPS O-acetylase OafA/YrhL